MHTYTFHAQTLLAQLHHTNKSHTHDSQIITMPLDFLSHSAVIDTLQEENENLKKDLALAGSKQNESKVGYLRSAPCDTGLSSLPPLLLPPPFTSSPPLSLYKDQLVGSTLQELIEKQGIVSCVGM